MKRVIITIIIILGFFAFAHASCETVYVCNDKGECQLVTVCK
jgi:hypothetical protein